MKLYTFAGSFRAQKVLVAAEYAGVKVTPVVGGSVTGKAPVDRRPLLETAEGCLFESNAIMRFVADGAPAVSGKDAFAKASINSWMDWSANELETPATMAVAPIIGWSPNDPVVTKRAMDDLKEALKVLDGFLKKETFLAGRSVTLADIAVACALVLPMKLVLDAKVRKGFGNVTRWFETVANQPEFLKVVGPVTLVKSAVKPSAPAVASEAPAKKEAAKEPAKEEPKKEEKPKDPFAALPKSNFVMDAWKRQYSNSGDFYSSMPWFWENLDKEGYSIWFSKYNYNEENTVGFQTSNLAGGFLQRCDGVRKHLFGAMAILGADPPFEMSGCWLIRGQSIDPLLEANPDAEYHTWTKVEDFSEDVKKLIADFWCAEDKLEGKAIFDSKLFK